MPALARAAAAAALAAAALGCRADAAVESTGPAAAPERPLVDVATGANPPTSPGTAWGEREVWLVGVLPAGVAVAEGHAVSVEFVVRNGASDEYDFVPETDMAVLGTDGARYPMVRTDGSLYDGVRLAPGAAVRGRVDVALPEGVEAATVVFDDPFAHARVEVPVAVGA